MHLLDPWPGPALRTTLSIDRLASDSQGQTLSTLYQVQRCDQTGRCTDGVAKPQIQIRITQSSPTTVSFEATVDYSVAAEQAIGFTTGASHTETSMSVPKADPMHRVYVKRATLKYGEQRRLDLPYGESLTFCARQVTGGLQYGDQACEPPSTADQAKAIPAF